MKKTIIFLFIIFGILSIALTVNAAPIQITTSSVNLSSNNGKKIVQDGLGNYYVTYTYTYSSYTHIFVRKSTDGGNTWLYWDGALFTSSGTETPIESYSYNQNNPSIAVDSSNNLHVVWTGRPTSAGYDDVRYSKYTAATGMWSAPVNLSNTTNYNQYYPSIAIDNNGDLHVVWYGRNAGVYFQIRYNKYSSGSWSAPIFLTNENYNQLNPAIAIDSSNNLYVVWYGQSTASTSYQQIRYAKYNGSWSAAADITSLSANQTNSAIAIDSSNNVHVVWNNGNIMYSKYNGTVWSSPVNLGTGGNPPTIDVDGSNNLHVIWQSGATLWYARYTNMWTRGFSFTATVNQQYPNIIKGASVFVWQGTTSGSVPSITGTSMNGAMFASVSMLQTYADQEVYAPISADIADNGNGGDIRVTFTGAIDETNISGYRILVVPSTQAGVFTVATAGSSGNYVSEPKNGSQGSHTVVLSSLVNDTSGNAITNMVPYQIFILALGQNSYSNLLSNGSNYLTLTAPTSPATVNKITNVSVDLSYNNGKKIVKDSAGNYYIAYIGPYNGVNNVFVRKSDDGGTTWKYYNGSSYGVTGPEVPLYSATTSSQYNVSITIDSNDNLYAVWTGRLNGMGYDEVRYSKYTSSTGTWSTAANITSSSTYNQYNPSMVVDSNNDLHLVWHGRTGSYFQTKYSKYSLGSWSAPLDLTSGNYNQNNPSIAIDSSNNLYVVWYGTSAASPTYNQIRYAIYNGSWLVAADITSAGANQQYPAIAIDSGNTPHIVWDNGNIQYSKYTGTWSAPVSLGAGGYGPTIDIDASSNIHVIWRNGTVLKHSTYSGTWSAAVSMTAIVNQQYPSLIKGANAMVWQGTVTGSSIPFSGTSMNGMMFYELSASSQVPASGTPTASDVGNNHDARDIRVVFTGASDETNINGYRIYVVPSVQAGTFSVSIATSLGSTMYVSESKNGNNGSHNLTLIQTLTDTSGASVTEGVSYKVFILARGQNSYISTLSLGSSIFVISSGVPKANGISASDAANNGDGRDIHVTFTGASDETNIGTYRIYVVPTSQVGSFDEPTASGLAASRFVVEPTNGANGSHIVTLTQTLLDSTGAAIQNGTAYTIFVMSIGSSGYSNTISIGSASLTLQPNVPLPSAGSIITMSGALLDEYNNGDGRDIRIMFKGAADESHIQEYRVIVVRTAVAGSFDVTAAGVLTSTRYVLEPTKGKSRLHLFNLTQALKNSEGNSIVNGLGYTIYVFTVAKTGYASTLTSLGTVTLDPNVPLIGLPAPMVQDMANNNNALDLMVTFKKPKIEGDVQEYRIFVWNTSAPAFNLVQANTNTNYKQVLLTAGTKYGYTINLAGLANDTRGGTNAIQNGQAYQIYVLAVMNKAGMSNMLSNPSKPITLSPYVPAVYVVRGLFIAKVGTGHNSSNIKVNFNEPAIVSNIQNYRIMIVPAAATLSQSSAEGAAVYQIENSIGKGVLHSLALNSGLKTHSNAALAAGDYKVYVLVMGSGGSANKLSGPSGKVTLD